MGVLVARSDETVVMSPNKSFQGTQILNDCNLSRKADVWFASLQWLLLAVSGRISGNPRLAIQAEKYAFIAI